jgi:DNA-binding transcriptional MerR regulator
MKYPITHYSGESAVVYPAEIIARLARISLQMLFACEQEGLIQCYDMPEGIRAYRLEDVHLLACIRRLHNDLELEFNAIEIILNMRHQINTLQAQLQARQQRMALREQELLEEIRRLREKLYEPLDEA